jgi:hypothetical protein
LQVPLHGTFTSSWPSRYAPLHKMKGDINGVSWTRERAIRVEDQGRSCVFR